MLTAINPPGRFLFSVTFADVYLTLILYVYVRGRGCERVSDYIIVLRFAEQHNTLLIITRAELGCSCHNRGPN